MSRGKKLDKRSLLGKLPEIEYEPADEGANDMLEQLSLGRSLLKLAEIDHESEYKLCRSVAEWLLETVPEPEDAELEGE